MTVIQPNSISGINSITVQSGEALSIHKSDGSVLREIVDNTGVSTFHSIKVGTAVSIHNNGNLGITGIMTAASYVGDGSALSGIEGGVTSDAQGNTVGGTNSGDSFSGTSAVKNTLYGYNSGTAITSGDNNTAFGYDALKTVATTEGNTAFGYEALKVADGDLGTAVGNSALANDTGDGYNSALGSSAGGSVTSGTNNSFLGYTAGSNLETGDYNIILGAWARSSTTGVDRECTIGGESSTRVTNRFRIPGIGLTITGNTSNPYPSSGSQLYLPGGADFVGVVTATNFVPTQGQLANRNVIINGAMKVAQRGTSEASVNSQKYADAPDRFKFKPNGTVAFTLSQATSSPNGFGFSYGFECSTANGSPGAGDYVWFEQRLEGFDVQRFNKGTADALQFALSFYVKTNESGVYAVELDDEDNTRKVSGTFTVADGNWNRHTIIFPADTTGAFGDDSGRSLVVRWWLLAGSNYTSGSLNSTWGAPADSARAVGQTGNVAADTSSEFYITGVQLEAGPAVTPFEHRSYIEDLARCQRYYYRETIANNDFFTGMGMADVDGNTVILNLPFPVTMRQEPSLDQTGTAGNYMIRRSTTQQCTSVPSIGSASTPYQASVNFVKSSHGWGDGSAVRCGAWGTSYLGFDAEI